MACTAATTPLVDTVSMLHKAPLVLAVLSSVDLVMDLAYQVHPVAAEASFPCLLQVDSHPVPLARQHPAPGPAPAPAAAAHGHNRNFVLCHN